MNQMSQYGNLSKERAKQLAARLIDDEQQFAFTAVAGELCLSYPEPYVATPRVEQPSPETA